MTNQSSPESDTALIARAEKYLALYTPVSGADALLREVVDALRRPAQSRLDWLADHQNYELSFSGWDEDPAWQVHSVNGGRNDREWTLIGTGSTPDEALRKAMAVGPDGGDPA